MSLAAAVVCLALNVYEESRGEDFYGKAMVALVTLNRADHTPQAVCPTVFEPYQFSWTMRYQGSVQSKIRQVTRLRPPTDDAWHESVLIATMALEGWLPEEIVNLVGNSDHYFNPSKANPSWRHAMQPVAQIGNHLLLNSKLNH